MDIMTYKVRGDKKNSDFFNEYLYKIYERRQNSGIDDLVSHMRAVLLQVDSGDAIDYLANELYVISPYRLEAAYQNSTHRIYICTIRPEYPYFFVFEPLDKNYEDSLTRFNALYVNSRVKPNARYIGEIYHSQDVNKTKRILTDQSIIFSDAFKTKNVFFMNKNFAFTKPSDFTWNRVGYTSLDFSDLNAFEMGEAISLSPTDQSKLKSSEEKVASRDYQKFILGIDHMATRILAGEREDAILEFLTLVPYYYWGAYSIDDMNSSTNVGRFPDIKDDKLSPAKVFTANNTPAFVNSFKNMPMPTEQFVRLYGKRMHHIALEVIDGNYNSTEKNIDHVIGTLMSKEFSFPFIATLFGECKDHTPDLKQIFSKTSPYSVLITEFIERCQGFDNFFTKSNVAHLTAAAGEEEDIIKQSVGD